MKKHAVRIVGGEFRKTPIAVVDAPGLRPSPDRVRETLFNWLRHFWMGGFSGKRILDLFAGTGALGFEAASHGVAEVHMVECHSGAVAALRRVQQRLNVSTVHIHEAQAKVMLKQFGGHPFDLILLDPPFGKGWLETLWPELPGILVVDGMVYAESEAPIVVPDTFEVLREARAGQVHFCLLRLAATQDTDI